MFVGRRAKELSIFTGTYKPARWLSRRLHRGELRSHLDDIRFYRSFFPASTLCFDVGANIGTKSEAMLRAGGRVVAFEPSPVAQLELKARCGREKNWTLVPAAVGAEAGIGALHAARESDKSSLVEGWRGDIIKTYFVPIVTLDTAIKTFGKPFFCKIDVEGWEPEVLKGLTQPIPLISFEFHLSEEGISKALSCLTRLSAFGPHQVNIAAAEAAFFLFQEWKQIDEFVTWFPGDLKNILPKYSYGDLYGDIFVKQTPGTPSC